MPTRSGDSPLEAALSYYASAVVLNAEGDSMVSDETLEGLGTTGYLFQALFGSILKLAKPAVVAPAENDGLESRASSVSSVSNVSSKLKIPDDEQPRKRRRILVSESVAVADEPRQPRQLPVPSKPKPPAPPPPPLPPDSKSSDDQTNTTATSTRTRPSTTGGTKLQEETDNNTLDISELKEEQIEADEVEAGTGTPKRLKLTHYLPHPGYFLAGALAGGISRTATAPFDRLKVYLLVNTTVDVPRGTPAAVVEAARTAASTAAKKPARPIREAIVSLYKSGGPKTFFAGKC